MRSQKDILEKTEVPRDLAKGAGGAQVTEEKVTRASASSAAWSDTKQTNALPE